MPLVPDFLAGRTPPDLYHAYLSPAFERWAVDMLGILKPNGRVLDIACGTGVVSRLAAKDQTVDLVEAIDVAPPMIDKAVSLGGGVGDCINYSVASAIELPFEDECFATAYCQQGLQFFPDRPKALHEARRVLQPGGKAAFATWCYARDGNPVFEAFEQIIADALGSDLVPFGPFAFGEREVIEELADEAGFRIELLEKRTLNSPLPDIRTFVLFDVSFLGRPAADGTLQPIMDFEDPANDAVIEDMISRLAESTAQFVQEDGTLLAPMTSHLLVVARD